MTEAAAAVLVSRIASIEDGRAAIKERVAACGSTARLTTLAEATPAMATTAAVENFMFEWFGW